MRDLARKLDVPHSWIEKIEQAERRMDIAEFVVLCEALRLDPHKGLNLLRSSRRTKLSGK